MSDELYTHTTVDRVDLDEGCAVPECTEKATRLVRTTRTDWVNNQKYVKELERIPLCRNHAFKLTRRTATMDEREARVKRRAEYA